METLKIKAAVAAAKYKSFSKAAEEFSYTPSAFSHMIVALEGSLGIKLFKRSSVGVELTDEGKSLLVRLEALVEAERQLTDAALALSDAGRQELKVGSFSSISRNLLSGIIKDFKKENPDVRLTITVGDNPEGWLDEGLADIVFADDTVYSSGEWFPIMEDRYMAAFAEGSVDKSKKAVTREELYSLPYIFTEDSYLKEYFDLSRFSELIRFKSEDDLSVINMVREGLGFAILPELMLKAHSKGITTLTLEPTVVRTLGFFYKKSKNSAPVLNRFVRHLKKIYS